MTPWVAALESRLFATVRKEATQEHHEVVPKYATGHEGSQLGPWHASGSSNVNGVASPKPPSSVYSASAVEKTHGQTLLDDTEAGLA